jgi:hypothetical protein
MNKNYYDFCNTSVRSATVDDGSQLVEMQIDTLLFVLITFDYSNKVIKKIQEIPAGSRNFDC